MPATPLTSGSMAIPSGASSVPLGYVPEGAGIFEIDVNQVFYRLTSQ
jgi:hypothetical protein